MIVFGAPQLQNGNAGSREGLPRVLYVSHGHSERRRGGAENAAQFLYEAVRAEGSFEPWLIAATPADAHEGTPWRAAFGDPRQLLLAGGEYDSFWGRLTERSRATRDWPELLAMLRPDVVHFHHVFGVGYDFLWQVRNHCPVAPIVFTLHDYFSICAVNEMRRVPNQERCSEATPARCHECSPGRSRSQHFLRTRWIRSALDLVDRFVAPSEFLARMYVTWGLPAERIVRLDSARPGPRDRAAESGHAEGPPSKFGYFGQLSEIKGLLTLLRAARLLHARGVRFELAIHGVNLELQPAHFRVAFRRELAACPPTVMLRPAYDPAEVHRLMRAVDWVVVPSEWWENSPLVIQEAYQSGRPVICSDIGGMAESVRHGVDGLHFAAGDASSLAATLEKASGARDEWARLCRGIRRPPDPAETAAAHVALYRELRAQRRAAAPAAEPTR